MRRRDALKAGLAYGAALFLPGCGGGSGGSDPPSPGPLSPPPCPASKFAKGLQFASQQRLDNIVAAPQATAPGAVQLPTYFSLDDQSLLASYGYPSALLPPIGNQGQQSSCVAWGVGYAAGSYLQGLFRQTATASPADYASPADLYAKVLQLEESGCGNGTQVADALDVMTIQGVGSLADVPYSAAYCSPPSQLSTFLLNGYAKLDPTNATSLKTYLSSFFVIPIAIYVYPDFENASGSSVFSLSAGSLDCSLGGHCVLLVGYDDTRAAYRIMNSWGTQWGDNGFLWVSYDTFAQMVQEAYVPTGPAPIINGSGHIVPGSITTNGSVALAAASAISWDGPDPNSDTPFVVATGFALNNPLQVASVVVQYSDSNPANTLTLGDVSVQQWSRSMTFQFPVTAAQDGHIFNTAGGTVSITVTGQSTSGEAITTSCQVMPSTLR